MRKLITMVIIAFLSFGVVTAQTRLVSGKVTDSKGQPVPRATIEVKGGASLAADENGNFQINAKTGDLLTITAVDFITATAKVDTGVIVTISLAGQTDQLNEVVVTAFGIRREKRSLGFSVQEVKGENLTVAKSIDVSSSIAGKVSGVKLVGTPSSTFDNANILIRGVTGLRQSFPIYVVDGTITDQAAVLMDNVENLSVLKGPAATALYGQRAANGAVVITSKKGSRKKQSTGSLPTGQ